MNNEVVDLNLAEPTIFRQWTLFMENRGIINFDSSETRVIDSTIGIFDDSDRLIATGSSSGNILKYIAVSDDESYTGLFNSIVSTLVSRLAQRGIFHVFVFTNPEHMASFEFVGFKKVAQTDFIVLLENGDQTIESYLQSLPRIEGNPKIAGIVMNANPFTQGHRYLVEQALLQNDFVYVFVVSADYSLFNSQERYDLVKKGLSDLSSRVIIVAGGDYIISAATFPAYFLKSNENTIEYQSELDAQIFKERIAKALGISSRFLGSEPFSKTTGIYNRVVQETLEPDINVHIVERKKNDGRYVTATEVRKAIKNNKIDSIEKLVPDSTYDFIKSNLGRLQNRIERGMNINGN
ncbi:[citrate (pro-3S)-lyase] ligase [Paucilactobacillus kaifaensis]|uniref:[citrate (pro-3S)-lyase] ligase n=1 Tax=Paucilactobacillus kaifaensis TaxID=2559921 RepID=UPI0010F6F965|nr:[citrate (pro-3S)-lyase] ligase [Paucilactobacillus kaifaensis]